MRHTTCFHAQLADIRLDHVCMPLLLTWRYGAILILSLMPLWKVDGEGLGENPMYKVHTSLSSTLEVYLAGGALITNLVYFPW
jgi:hypothetical protein